MCYEFWRSRKEIEEEERARREAEEAIKKAGSGKPVKPTPAAPAEERPVTADQTS